MIPWRIARGRCRGSVPAEIGVTVVIQQDALSPSLASATPVRSDASDGALLAVVDVSAVVPIGGGPAGEVQVLLVGDLVAATVHAARRELGQCLDRATRRIVLDLERIRVDACGLPVLADLVAAAASRGVGVELRSAGDGLRCALGLEGLPAPVAAPASDGP